MTMRRPERFVTLLSVFLLFALAAGALNLHAHTEGRGKTCTLCQAPHVHGSLSSVAHLSGPRASAEPMLARETAVVPDGFIPSASSRAPPSAPAVV